MVHPRGVAIAPGDLDGVAADELDFLRADVLGNRLSSNHPLSGFLVHANGAGTQETELEVGERVLLTRAPVDAHFRRAQGFDSGGVHLEKSFDLFLMGGVAFGKDGKPAISGLELVGGLW